ncbi:hypothetical protein KC19_10G021200 [Ceratodon purpureus]|uniref:Uncharacterized protein n=1 Tax=Ceratodon purpureus TaxID=3225 RepID=A0A8T0GFY8_CERPU|nr:hypothetical protein KC19_10G021200 [Ceratodon purpureus]
MLVAGFMLEYYQTGICRGIELTGIFSGRLGWCIYWKIVRNLFFLSMERSERTIEIRMLA